MEKINYNGPYTGDLNDRKVIYYKNNDEECLKNYVWYSGKLWRIVAIYQDGKIIVPATEAEWNIQMTTATTDPYDLVCTTCS